MSGPVDIDGQISSLSDLAEYHTISFGSLLSRQYYPMVRLGETGGDAPDGGLLDELRDLSLVSTTWW